MAIGTLAAVGLGLAGAGSVIGGISSGKAAGKAADTALQTAEANNALAREIYGQNQQVLNPYVQRGNAAGNQMNALLGLGGPAPVAPGAAPQPNALAQQAAPSGWRDLWQGGRTPLPGTVGGYAGGTFSPDGTPVTTGGNGTPSVPADPGRAANDAFDIFRNSTGYQFRLGEGMDSLNSLYAGAGTIQSGAAMKAAQRYGQDFASNEFGNYMGYLGNQQGVGLSGASALAGVGQNYANSVMTNNNNAGSAAMNAALYRGSNNPLAGALGMIGGGMYGLSK